MLRGELSEVESWLRKAQEETAAESVIPPNGTVHRKNGEHRRGGHGPAERTRYRAGLPITGERDRRDRGDVRRRPTKAGPHDPRPQPLAPVLRSVAAIASAASC